MASTAQWFEAARLRTLPAAIAPVLVGSAIAIYYDGFSLLRMLLAMGVALALQVGVNFSNDYSDGIRGTDSAQRVGPQRLVGSAAAKPKTVKRAAFICFGIGAVFGLTLTGVSGQWWLIIVGAAAIIAAWFYTGGKHPYGYIGLGEVFVFIFFGLVATVGTSYTQLGYAPPASWIGATSMGAVACAVLVCNNLRDLAQDKLCDKKTLAVRLGDTGTRVFYTVLAVGAILTMCWLAALTSWWLILGAAGALIFLAPAIYRVLTKESGMGLVKVLKFTGLGELAAGIGCFVGVLI